jgi:hypothetical protein
MGFANRVVRSKYRTLHVAETTFGRVDVSDTAKGRIFIRRMVACGLTRKVFADKAHRTAMRAKRPIRSADAFKMLMNFDFIVENGV